jgi:hypothetical protein
MANAAPQMPPEIRFGRIGRLFQSARFPDFRHTHDRYAYRRIAAGSVIAHRPFQLAPDVINGDAEKVVPFLRDLLKHLRGNVIVVWDRGNNHKGPIIREFLGPALARQLLRLPAGNQQAVLALTRRETLTAQEVSGVIDLLHGASPEQAAQVLAKPREALAAARESK